MNEPNFSDKILSISTSGDSYNHDLISPKFEEVAGRIFITGRIPRESTQSGWNENKIGAVAWDIVTEYVIFDTYEEYKASTEKSEAEGGDDSKESD